MPRARRLCRWSNRTTASGATVPAHLADPGRSDCETHRMEEDARRGSRQSRGYGAAHDRLRARWAPRVADGTVNCARCLKRIEPGQPWHLGHTEDRSGYQGPEHERCSVLAAIDRGFMGSR